MRERDRKRKGEREERVRREGMYGGKWEGKAEKIANMAAFLINREHY